jgi:metal-responsive CopG/Arc/MetJ family transcriptional regulator
MKIAVSIPDDIFVQAEALAKRTRQSRSRLYAQAIQSYVAAHEPESLTSAINAVLDASPINQSSQADDMIHVQKAAAATALAHTEW